MSKSYGFGILGLGMISRFHALAIADLDNGHVAGCCSRDAAKADAFAAEFGGAAYTDIAAMLADPDIDVVTICTPSGLHADAAVAAALAGKHVICEKPIDISLAAIDRMVDAHDKAGTTLCGIFPYRFNDVTKVIKNAADSGRFGTMIYGGAYVPWWRDQAYYDEGGWKGTAALDGGGALMNQSIHVIDSLLWIMGPVTSVSARTSMRAHTGIDVEDTAAATLTFANGALGTVMGSTAIYPGHLRRLEIFGNGGSAVCVEEDLTVWTFADELPEDEETRTRFATVTKTGGGASDPSSISYEGHRRNFAACLESIDTAAPPPIDGAEARKAVEVILAIYRSAANDGAAVTLPVA